MKKNFWQTWFKPKPPLPQVTSPFNAAIKKQQERWLMTFIIALFFTGFYTYNFLENQQQKHQLVSVVVAKKDLASPHKIEAGDLTTVRLPQKHLPVQAYTPENQSKLIGQTTRHKLSAKQIILPQHVQADLDPESISAQFTESLALAMDEGWFQAKLPTLKPNDRIDIMVSNPKEDFEATVAVARQLKVLEVRDVSHKRSLVVNLTEADSKAILFARALRLPMQVLVHSQIKP